MRLNDLGVRTLNYFPQFDLDPVIRNGFFFSGRVAGARLRSVTQPPRWLHGAPPNLMDEHEYNLFRRAVHQRHFEAPYNGSSITSIYQRRNQGTKLFRR